MRFTVNQLRGAARLAEEFADKWFPDRKDALKVITIDIENEEYRNNVMVSISAYRDGAVITQKGELGE